MEVPELCYAVETGHETPTSSINQNHLTMSTALKPRDHLSMSKKRVMRNFIVMGSSYFTCILAFQSLSNLQSTMNSVKGTGMYSQAIIYACSMLSSLFLPDLLIKQYGCKRTIVCMLLLNIPFTASNFSPSWNIIMPSSALVGIAIGPFNSAGALYVNEMAIRYHKFCPTETLDSVVARFFGLYSFFLENTQIWGSLVSYYVLRPGIAPIRNQTNITCGIDFVKSDSSLNPNLEPPSDDKRFLLVSIFLLSNVIAAVFMGLFTDKLDNDTRRDERTMCSTVLDRFFSAAKHMFIPKQILIIPITVFTGMELAFYTAEFTEAYIACSWGVHHVGFVTICFGVCGAIMSLFVGPLVKCVSQMAVLIFAACCNVTICVLLFLWLPSPDTISIYFIIAGIWGMSDAIWWSQITALYGLMFPNDREAAFSNLYFWSFLGFFISYSYANYLNVAVKINILLIFLLTGIIGYLIGQIKIRCAVRREYVNIEE